VSSTASALRWKVAWIHRLCCCNAADVTRE
jgi:hypothetical protein